MNTDVMFSSKSDEYATPKDIFNELDREFHFNLDPCATDENHKCPLWFTKENDGLCQNWGGIEYSAIHHIARYLNGLRNAIRKVGKMEHLLSC